MGYSQSYISKTINNVTKPFIPSIDYINEDQLTRKYVVDTILELKHLPTVQFGDQDRAYIKLLDYLLVDREKIRKLYYNVSQYKISQAYRSKKISLSDFDPTLIGLTTQEYAKFLEKCA